MKCQMEGKPRFNTKRFEAFKGATGGYNINIFSPDVRSSLMSKTVNRKNVVLLKVWSD